MLGYFPQPLPDETFFSVIARFTNHTGVPSLSAFGYELTGTYTSRVNTRLGNDVSRLVAILPPGHGLTVEELIDQHTLLPLYASALTAKQANELRDWVIGPTGRLVGIFRSLPVARDIRYCPMCAAEDRQTYGEPYWHRLHQIRSVLICAQHQIQLSIGVKGRGLQSMSYAQVAIRDAERVVGSLEAKAPVHVDMDLPGTQLQTQLIADVTWLLAQPSAWLPSFSLRNRALEIAYRSGLLQDEESVDFRVLARAIAAMSIGMDTCRATAGDDVFTYAQECHWWEKAMRNVGANGDPMPWLLMMRAAGYSVQDIFQLPSRSSQCND